MMIKQTIIRLSLHDVRSLLEGNTSLGQITCPEYLLPPVILHAALDAHARGTDWFWCAPRLFVGDDTGQTLGTASFFATYEAGIVEIGYGTATEFQGMGVASRGIAQMLAQAQAHDSAMRYKAKTASSNIASRRVLEKNGFSACGKAIDPEDGELILWSRK